MTKTKAKKAIEKPHAIMLKFEGKEGAEQWKSIEHLKASTGEKTASKAILRAALEYIGNQSLIDKLRRDAKKAQEDKNFATMLILKFRQSLNNLSEAVEDVIDTGSNITCENCNGPGLDGDGVCFLCEGSGKKNDPEEAEAARASLIGPLETCEYCQGTGEDSEEDPCFFCGGKGTRRGQLQDIPED